MNQTPVLSILYEISEMDCWLCLTGVNHNGYRRIVRGGKRRMAHRQAWEETYGPIPAGMQVLHRCDVRRCVRPDHLFLGSHADNMADKAAKGRALHGSNHPFAVLSDEQVREIRSDNRTHREIAKSYGIGTGTVGKIRRRQKWRHLP